MNLTMIGELIEYQFGKMEKELGIIIDVNDYEYTVRWLAEPFNGNHVLYVRKTDVDSAYSFFKLVK